MVPYCYQHDNCLGHVGQDDQEHDPEAEVESALLRFICLYQAVIYDRPIESPLPVECYVLRFRQRAYGCVHRKWIIVPPVATYPGVRNFARGRNVDRSIIFWVGGI